ncbi:MAG: hypothetical protein O9267_07390 [Flavobacterium sp.]|uniref:hypothetical protein n=1 Tax=Flavobacterium sp. TaxID=239 RepID=UPI0022C1EE58|nr:hypothetical protein [Flavobacterium sp.]MCZ8197414.1 hypothetical protein [Flavobacterium sp.]
MEYILLLFIVVLLLMVGFLSFQNYKMKEEHKSSMEKLETLLATLNHKQLYLNDKVSISSDYNSNQKVKVKKLSEEIVNLQKILLEIISIKNNA